MLSGGSGVFATSSAIAMSEVVSKTNQNTIKEKNKTLNLSADKMYYSDLNKDVKISGNVIMKYENDVFQTEKIYGNVKEDKYILPTLLKWTHEDFEVNAKKGEYHGKTSDAYLQEIDGNYQDIYYFKGKELKKDGQKGIFTIKNGYITSKSARAKVPDYRVEADSLEFLPKNYYSVKNARFMIKNTEIFRIKQYRGHLGRRKKVDLWYLVPRIKSSRELGIGIYNTVYVPLGKQENVYFYIGNEWYTKVGYVQDIGFEWDTLTHNVKIHKARVQSLVNDEVNFIWKEPSLDWEIKEIKLGKSPIYVKANGDFGKWSENSIKGTHIGYNVNFTGSPIKINKKLKFDWQVGYSKDYYGYDNSTRSDKYYSLGIFGEFEKFKTEINYTDHNFEGTTPYKYDKYDNIKPITMSIRTPITRLDEVEIKYVIDTSNGNLKNRYYTYYRDMHSLKGKLSYDSVKNRFDFSIDFKDF